MKALINFTFLFLFFFNFSQEDKLTIIYEQLENKSYLIKDINNKSIGFIEFNKSLNEFEYFNVNNELVGKEPNPNDYQGIGMPFDLKTTTEFLDKFGEPIFVRFWDEEQGRFNVFLDGEEIGHLKYNKSKKHWEYFKKTYLEIDAFANIFKIKSIPEPKVVFKNLPTNKTNNITNYNNTTKKKKREVINIKKNRTKRNRNIYGTALSLGENDGMRFGLDFFRGDYSLGLTMRIAPSDIVYDDDPLSDWDVGMTYGTGILNNLAFMKFGLGIYSYNYDITESFGPFYDIGITAYYSLGLQLNLGVFTPEIYYNNMGIGYGVGFVF